MNDRVYLDTHVVIWLYDGRYERLSTPMKEAVNRGTLFASEFVRLELKYLEEIGRLVVQPDTMLRLLQDTIGLAMCTRPLGPIVTQAFGHSWTRDPFDRLIVATASVGPDNLLSADVAIREHYRHTVY